MAHHSPKQNILYSEKYYDATYEYRHVILPKEISVNVPKGVHLTEPQWRSLGICMSRGWIHYGGHEPEPNILLFRRRFSGKVNPRKRELKKIEHWEKRRKKAEVNMDY